MNSPPSAPPPVAPPARPAREFAAGAATIVPGCIAAFPVGMVWGALATEKGLSLAEIGLMSTLVFAGASQFVALGVWAQPLPVLAILFATALVNLRLVFLGASLVRKMQGFPRWGRYLALYGLVDEVWAFAEARALRTPLTPAFWAGLVVPLIFAWVGGSLAGAAFGRVLPDPKAFGLDFAFTAMFIALIIGRRRAPRWLPVVAASALASILAHRFLPSPWFILAGCLAGMAIAAALAPRAAPPMPASASPPGPGASP